MRLKPQSNDCEQNTQASELLPLVKNLVKRYYGRYDDDVFGVAIEAMVRGMRSFDGRGSLKGYVSLCVCNAIRDRQRRDRRRRTLCFTDKTQFDPDSVASRDLSYDPHAMLDDVPDGPLAAAYYFDGVPIPELAAEHQTSVSTIQRRLSRFRQNMRVI